MLYEKYRPRYINQIIGKIQKESLRILLQSIKDGEPIKNVLLEGPSGVGKTTIAYIYAKTLLCENNVEIEGLPHPCYECHNCKNSTSFVEVNCATSGIDIVREIEEKIDYRPLFGTSKIYYLDELHELNKKSQNGLLIPVERSPDYIYFIFSTTDTSKIIKTLYSRLVHFNLKPPSVNEQFILAKSIINHYSKTTQKDIEISNDALEKVVEVSNGNIRTLVMNIEKLLRGGFIDNEEEDSFIALKDIFSMYRKQKINFKKILEYVNSISDYQMATLSIVRYASVVLQNSKNEYDIDLAVKIIKKFGLGLDGNTTEKNIFLAYLLECIT